MDPTPSSVLFVCGQNAIRSPMACALMRALFPHRIYAASAGVRRGDADPFVVAVMEELGIDLGDHQPHTIEDLEDTNFDLVITLAPEAHHKALELTRTQALDVEYWPTADPSTATGSRDQILASYRTVRDHLQKRIEARFTQRSSGNPNP